MRQKRSIRRAGPGGPRGREAIQEAAAFLSGARFSMGSGSYADGQHVSVHIDASPNDDGETMAVLVSCLAFGHRPVDWDGMPLFIFEGDRAETDPVAVPCLNRQGQTAVERLPIGRYCLLASATSGRSDRPVPARLGSRWPPTYPSIDGRVRVTITEDPTRLREVSAESMGPGGADMVGATVLYAFVDPATRLARSSGRCRLEQTDQTVFGTSRFPVAHAATAPADSDFVFCVLPSSE